MHEVDGCLTQRDSLDGGPQVDDVALLGTARQEALEDVLVEVDAEGLAPLAAVGVLAVQRTWALALTAAATQSVQKLQMFEHAPQRQLGFDMVEVEPRPGSRL